MLSFDVLANDADADGDSLTIVAVDATPTTAPATKDGTGVRYVPGADYCGPDSFTYTASDGAADRHGHGHRCR